MISSHEGSACPGLPLPSCIKGPAHRLGGSLPGIHFPAVKASLHKSSHPAPIPAIELERLCLLNTHNEAAPLNPRQQEACARGSRSLLQLS